MNLNPRASTNSDALCSRGGGERPAGSTLDEPCHIRQVHLQQWTHSSGSTCFATGAQKSAPTSTASPTVDVDELTNRVYDIAASINAVVADCAGDLNDLEAKALFGAANTTRSLLAMLDSVASF